MRPFCPIALATLALLGQVRPAAATDILSKTGSVELPAEPLAEALMQLAVQMDFDIAYEGIRCDMFRTKRLRGTLTMRQALAWLLRGTGLQPTVLDTRTIMVSPRKLKGRQPPNGEAPDTTCVKPDAISTPPGPTRARTPNAEVTVTGSHVRMAGNLNNDSTRLVYDRQALEQMGFTTLAEFFRSLPQNLASNSRSTYGVGDSHNAELATSVNLMGIGEAATLVLLDGHRMAPAAQGDFVDVSLLPLSAVDRIEILTGGNSAEYGSDAVAGVINIVPRKYFTGTDSSVSYSVPYDTNATKVAVSSTTGTSWADGNAVASLNWSDDRPLLGTDRFYSNAPGFDLTPGTRDYDGFLHIAQDLRPDLGLSFDGLYARRSITDDINYIEEGFHVGPYSQNGVSDQFTVAPTLDWTVTDHWHATADFDFSESHFEATTLYGLDAIPSGAMYVSLNGARIRTADLGVRGLIPGLPGGDMAVSAGVGGRWEDYDSFGDITAAMAPGSFSRHVASVYGAVEVPIIGNQDALPFVRRLDVSLALRAERYSDVGSATNPRISLRWQPTDSLQVSGNYGTSYSAPRYADTLTDYNVLVIQRFTAPACASGSCLIAEEFGANNHYQPEKATSFDATLLWTPQQLNGLQVRSSAYLIHYLDQIATPPDAAVLLAQRSYFPGLVVSDPSPAFMSGVLVRAANYPEGIINLAGGGNPALVDFYIDERTRNLSRTIASGIDLNVAYAVESPFGRWMLNLSGTRILQLDTEVSPIAPSVSVANTFARPVSTHYAGQLAWNTERLSLNLRVNYVGRYIDDQVSPPTPIASWTTLATTLTVPLNRTLPAAGPESRLQLTVDNVLNRPPPYAYSPLVPIGYDPVNASALGRVIGLHLLTSW
jgi:iron complex outermembrane recepter protein